MPMPEANKQFLSLDHRLNTAWKTGVSARVTLVGNNLALGAHLRVCMVQSHGQSCEGWRLLRWFLVWRLLRDN